MAQASQLWHVRPVLFSVASIAAVCTIIAVCSGYSNQSPNSGLRRSNAVHRARRERHAPRIDWSSTTPDAPLGTVVIRRGDLEYYLIDLARSPLPTIDELQRHFPRLNEETWTELVDIALNLVFQACSIAASPSVSWIPIQQLGLTNLTAAIASQDENQIRLHAGDARSILRAGGISEEQIERAVDRFVSSETWLEGSDLSADGDDAEPAETEEADLLEPNRREPSQGLRGLLYYIAEEDAKRKAYEHRGINCEECGEMPIRGVRWHCLNCPDFDLCASCETHTEHPKTHVFAKIKIPLPILSQPTKEYRLWYPGDPTKTHPTLDGALKTRLCLEHGFEEPQMDALYEQFTCLANVPWQADPSTTKAAIDKRAFNKALSCEKWSSEATSNALYDRMFSFYDTDGNGLIGFEEFLSGFAYLRGPRRFASLQRTIKGYDMNCDGFVDRADLMRLMRAKFTIQQQLVHDSIEEQEIEQTQNALEALNSSQPISSIFVQEDIPPGESRPRHGKYLDRFGDMRSLDGTKTILDNEDPWPRTLRNRQSMPAHETLQNNLSRFEELLHSAMSSEDRREVMEQADGLSPVFVPADRNTQPLEQEMQFGHLGFCGEDDGFVEPHIQDILWQATEDGFRRLLDALFLAKEEEDREAILTRNDRAKWRKEIDAVQEEERRFEEQLDIAANGSSPPSIAMNSTQSESPTQESTGTERSTPLLPSSIIPTDWESLERREHDITETSLDELLHVTGYSLRTDDEIGRDEAFSHHTSNGASAHWSGFTQHTTTSPLTTVTPCNNIDPTLPHNMPERHTENPQPRALRRRRGTPESLDTVETSPEQAPSQQRLQYLSTLDRVDRQLQDRGGPGRLTYDEVETIARTTGGEVCGLIRSWLEWASF